MIVELGFLLRESTLSEVEPSVTRYKLKKRLKICQLIVIAMICIVFAFSLVYFTCLVALEDEYDRIKTDRIAKSLGYACLLMFLLMAAAVIFLVVQIGVKNQMSLN